jgi:hypothetical protein
MGDGKEMRMEWKKTQKVSQLVNVSFTRKGMENITGNGTRERPERENLISFYLLCDFNICSYVQALTRCAG